MTAGRRIVKINEGMASGSVGRRGRGSPVRALTLLLTTLLLVSSGASAAHGAPASTAANSTNYVDASGDATAGGPDITTVTLANDDAGTLTFTIRIANYATLPADRYVGVFFDTDRNTSTGVGGADYRVFTEPPSAFPQRYRFARYDSTQNGWLLVENVLQSASYSNGVFSGRLNVSAFGPGVTVFNFFVGTYQGSGSTFPNTDVAPNSGLSTYEIRIGQPPPDENRVAITGLSRSPSTPVAGQTFKLSATVVRVGRQGRFAGTLVCVGTVGGRRIASKGSFPGAGRVACEWDVPASAAGKLLAAAVSVSEGGPAATRRYSARIAAPPKPRLVAGGANTDPAQPDAGRPFYYALTVVEQGPTGERRIQRGTASCRARIGGRSLEVVVQRVLKKEGILCGWQIPFGTEGSTLSAQIVVRSPNATSLTHRFLRRVR